ncbi:MAG TPA: elongation factor P maturation arginine rhamnosyltransferase EarP [Accumulibacter sp.]|nr:elongation factor P maturation arginine rhamnosyltransferase EarP [Accumulibacter sp.]HPP47131.1 elongation factor P maturation arginine rhamnosyltransferase EarP [Accumulibacter sp.]
MPPSASRPDWDIFCRVIDNFGDIGVCWRLARQLIREYRLRVRLWVNDLHTFKRLCPAVTPEMACQTIDGLDIGRWDDPFPSVIPGEVVLETFACHLPDTYVDRMAQIVPPPVWINLDYLSAENWVSGCHALPSPHPQLPLTKYFFFPGFTSDTGGLLRENDLELRRSQFVATPCRQAAFWQSLAQSAPDAGTRLVSLFAYDNPALLTLLQSWERSAQPVCCLAPATRGQQAVDIFAGRPLRIGESIRRGALEFRRLSFLAQEDYDQLLWLCDVNFVRGEDSFVRAQWAARPLVWHIYPQSENAHRSKLEAFLDRYRKGLPATADSALRKLWLAWNSGHLAGDEWQQWLVEADRLTCHAKRWQQQLLALPDLASSLLRFARSRI